VACKISLKVTSGTLQNVKPLQEARAEAIELMGTLDNLRTPKSGEVMICANQDFLTAAYLITAKDRFLTRAQFVQLCGFMDDACGHLDLPVWFLRALLC
jgi:DNA-directed RNA polymerase III subunit RPC1